MDIPAVKKSVISEQEIINDKACFFMLDFFNKIPLKILYININNPFIL